MTGKGFLFVVLFGLLVGGTVSEDIEFEVSNNDGAEFFVTEEGNEEPRQPPELDEIIEEELEEAQAEMEERQKQQKQQQQQQPQQQLQQQQMEAAFENSVNDALNFIIEEQILEERQQQQEELAFQSYREMEQANDVAEAVAFLNALMMSWFTEPVVPEVQGPTIFLSPEPVQGRSSKSISGLAETSGEEREGEEEDEEVLNELNEEYCYQLPLEFEVECLTALIQLLRDENEDLRAHSPVQATSHHTEHHYYHHHHHHDNNALLVAGALCCVVVGIVIGRCCQKKRKPCKVHQYQVLPQKEGVKANPQVEGEEREFYPYYVAAKV